MTTNITKITNIPKNELCNYKGNKIKYIFSKLRLI